MTFDDCRAALVNLAIDSKPRGCGIVSLRVDDVASHGYAIDRAYIRQRKTVRPFRFEVTEQTQKAIDDYLKVSKNKNSSGDFLFTGRRGKERGFMTR